MLQVFRPKILTKTGLFLCFQVFNENDFGVYKITDENVAAGNIVFIRKYKPATVSNFKSELFLVLALLASGTRLNDFSA